MKDKNYEYILSVHWKEGDDLVGHLKAQNNDAKKALISWADSMDQIALHLEKLVEIFEDKELVDLSHEIFGHIEGTEIFYK